MERLLCNLKFTKECVIKKHYVDYHAVNENDVHLILLKENAEFAVYNLIVQD